MAKPKTWKVLIAAAATAASSAMFTGCELKNPESTATKKDSHSYRFSGQVLRIKATEVRLRLKEGSGASVQVDRTAKGAATEARNAKLAMNDDTLTLGVRCEGVVLHCDLETTVLIPRGVDVVLTGSGAFVTADGLTGDLDLDVRDDGSITVKNSKGSLRLYSGGGNITVASARSSKVEARATADASIQLAFATAPRQVRARASDSVTVTLPRGPETYRITGSGVRGNLRSDSGSARSLAITADDGVARVDRKA